MTKTALLLNNRYQLIETLGRGGFGETYLAIDTHLPSQKKCVIKQLKPNINQSEIPLWIQDRFKQEALTLEHLGERNAQIPRLFAYFSEAGNFYLVQEWIKGITLAQKVEKQGSLPIKEVEKILINLLPVLNYVHHQSIVHRDIKPENIILRAKDELPILIDFGAVKQAMVTVETSGNNSAYSIAIGTPGYMASEQAAGRPIYSSDLYSLALTAVYLLTGESPQNLKTDPRTGEILWRDAAPEIHANLSTVIDKAIRFHPRDRFSSAQDMLKALQISQSFSSTPTMAIGNINHDLVQVTGNFREQETAIADSLVTPTKKNNWFKVFLPLLMLSGVAFGSLIMVFNVIQNLTSTPQLEVSEQPEPKKTISPENEEIDWKELPKAESTESTPEPESNNVEPEPIQETQQPKDPKKTTPAPKPRSVTSKKPLPPPQSPSFFKENKNVPFTVPIVAVGNSKTEVIGELGQPTSESEGYGKNQNSIVFSYQNIDQNQVDLGYIFDRNTKKILETQVSFKPSVDVKVMENALNDMLKDELSPPIQNALQEVYQKQTDLRAFNLGDLKGMIQRNSQDEIYIAVWKSDFH